MIKRTTIDSGANARSLTSGQASAGAVRDDALNVFRVSVDVPRFVEDVRVPEPRPRTKPPVGRRRR